MPTAPAAAIRAAAFAIAENLVPNIGGFSPPKTNGASLSLSTTKCGSVTDGWEYCAADLGTCWDGGGVASSLGILSFSLRVHQHEHG
jgi:hypothetical protein